MQKWKRNLALPVLIVAIGLGFLISLQLQTQKSVTEAEKINIARLQATKVTLETAKKKNQTLKTEHEELVNKLEEARKQGGTPPEILAEMAQTKIMNGTQEVSGSGIEITIDDRNQEHKLVYPIGVNDLLYIVNILKYAGAEAISVNGQRIVSTTAIVASGSNILINMVPIKKVDGAPFEILAIGNQETLVDYATKLIASNYKQLGSNVSITRKAVKIPSFKGSYNFSKSIVQQK